MEDQKFLHYCPNCNNYDESSGICNHLHENILQYPEKFIRYCDGKYLSLIRGRKIIPFDETEVGRKEETHDPEFVTVFTCGNNALYQVARSILNKNGIKFFQAGDYLNTLEQPVFNTEIRVHPKDEKVAKKLLSDLEPSPYHSSSKFQEFLARNILVIIALIMAVIITLIFILKK